MGHVGDQVPPHVHLDPTTARSVATTLQALASPSRLMILGRLREGPASVGQIVAAVGMEQPAVSHQLRLLRHLGLVTGIRSGRSITYALHDDHVAALLDQAVYHAQHLQWGIRDPPTEPFESRQRRECRGYGTVRCRYVRGWVPEAMAGPLVTPVGSGSWVRAQIQEDLCAFRGKLTAFSADTAPPRPPP